MEVLDLQNLFGPDFLFLIFFMPIWIGSRILKISVFSSPRNYPFFASIKKDLTTLKINKYSCIGSVGVHDGFTPPPPLIKDVQATGEAFSPQKRTSSTSKDEISYLFSIFLVNFFSPGYGSTTLV
jgi:hypothetical protein